MNASECSVVVLAAGLGKRMFSKKPKVLMEILGQPMLSYIYSTLEDKFKGDIWTVIGHGAHEVRERFSQQPKLTEKFILQDSPLGTGHALMAAWPVIRPQGRTGLLVVNGDTPLLQAKHIQALLNVVEQDRADLAFLSITLPEPGNYGRVLRKDGRVSAIIEAKDYDPVEHGPEPREVNAGVYWLRSRAIDSLLSGLRNDNKSGEYYLTDLVGLAVRAGLTVSALDYGYEPALLGLNNPLELSEAEELVRSRLVADWQRRGVLVRSAGQVRIGPAVSLEPGVELHGPCELYGNTVVSEHVRVMANTYINNSVLGQGCLIRHFSHLEEALVGPDCVVGPFARLRPGSVMERGSLVGNFVEMKKSRLGSGSKAAHLSYLGDADIDDLVNIGAGTITCNYDGRRKHATIIKKGAFIGSNTALVAPVTVGENAVIGAGSVITRDVDEGNLALTRAPQVGKPWSGKKANS